MRIHIFDDSQYVKDMLKICVFGLPPTPHKKGTHFRMAYGLQ